MIILDKSILWNLLYLKLRCNKIKTGTKNITVDLNTGDGFLEMGNRTYQCPFDRDALSNIIKEMCRHETARPPARRGKKQRQFNASNRNWSKKWFNFLYWPPKNTTNSLNLVFVNDTKMTVK